MSRRAQAYLVANVWEVAIAAGYFVQTMLYLALPQLLRHTPISRAFAEPLDFILTVVGFVASACILGGTLGRKPRIRAAGLVLLAGTILVRVVASCVVYGWLIGVYGLPLSIAAVAACLVRTLGIIESCVFPPPATPLYVPWER
jgi:hypothetical protein